VGEQHVVGLCHHPEAAELGGDAERIDVASEDVEAVLAVAAVLGEDRLGSAAETFRREAGGGIRAAVARDHHLAWPVGEPGRAGCEGDGARPALILPPTPGIPPFLPPTPGIPPFLPPTPGIPPIPTCDRHGRER
jgi:hypothetical protein